MLTLEPLRLAHLCSTTEAPTHPLAVPAKRWQLSAQTIPYPPCYNPLFPVAHRAEDRIDKRFIRTNDRIRAREIRVIGDEGEQIGVMPPFEALKLARSKNLDLVEISPTAVPPVCRIMDYGKFLYQQEK